MRSSLFTRTAPAYAWGNRIGQVSNQQYPNVSVVVDANGTTDYFEVYGYQSNAGASTVNLVNDPVRTYFSGAMLPGFTGSPGVGNQWSTSGSSIYYNGGAVGIGTAASPQRNLDVAGNIYSQGSVFYKDDYNGANRRFIL